MLLVEQSPLTVGAQSLPLVSKKLRRQLLGLAAEIGGTVDLEPGRTLTGAQGAILLPEASLLIAGADQMDLRPNSLLARTALCEGLDIILMRVGLELFTYDIFFNHGYHWVNGYIRWQQCPGVAYAPRDLRDGHLVQVGPHGLIVSNRTANDDQYFDRPIHSEIAA